MAAGAGFALLLILLTGGSLAVRWDYTDFRCPRICERDDTMLVVNNKLYENITAAEYGPTQLWPLNDLRFARPSPADGCTAGTGAGTAGTAAHALVVERGTCSYAQKTWLAQQQGAKFVVVLNYADVNPTVVCDDSRNVGFTCADLAIPTVIIARSSGAAALRSVMDAHDAAGNYANGVVTCPHFGSGSFGPARNNSLCNAGLTTTTRTTTTVTTTTVNTTAATSTAPGGGGGGDSQTVVIIGVCASLLVATAVVLLVIYLAGPTVAKGMAHRKMARIQPAIDMGSAKSSRTPHSGTMFERESSARGSRPTTSSSFKIVNRNFDEDHGKIGNIEDALGRAPPTGMPRAGHAPKVVMARPQPLDLGEDGDSDDDGGAYVGDKNYRGRLDSAVSARSSVSSIASIDTPHASKFPAADSMGQRLHPSGAAAAADTTTPANGVRGLLQNLAIDASTEQRSRQERSSAAAAAAPAGGGSQRAAGSDGAVSLNLPKLLSRPTKRREREAAAAEPDEPPTPPTPPATMPELAQEGEPGTAAPAAPAGKSVVPADIEAETTV